MPGAPSSYSSSSSSSAPARRIVTKPTATATPGKDKPAAKPTASGAPKARVGLAGAGARAVPVNAQSNGEKGTSGDALKVEESAPGQAREEPQSKSSADEVVEVSDAHTGPVELTKPSLRGEDSKAEAQEQAVSEDPPQATDAFPEAPVTDGPSTATAEPSGEGNVAEAMPAAPALEERGKGCDVEAKAADTEEGSSEDKALPVSRSVDDTTASRKDAALEHEGPLAETATAPAEQPSEAAQKALFGQRAPSDMPDAREGSREAAHKDLERAESAVAPTLAAQVANGADVAGAGEGEGLSEVAEIKEKDEPKTTSQDQDPAAPASNIEQASGPGPEPEHEAENAELTTSNLIPTEESQNTCTSQPAPPSDVATAAAVGTENVAPAPALGRQRPDGFGNDNGDRNGNMNHAPERSEDHPQPVGQSSPRKKTLAEILAEADRAMAEEEGDEEDEGADDGEEGEVGEEGESEQAHRREYGYDHGYGRGAGAAVPAGAGEEALVH